MSHAARLLALLLAATVMAGAKAQDRLWTSAEPIEHSLTSLSPAAVEAWRVSPRSALVADTRTALVLALPGREAVRAEIERVIHHGPTALTWIGSMPGEPGHVLLARRGEWISGVIQTATETWEIRPDGTHGQVLMRVDPEGFPACGGGIDPGEAAHSARPGSSADPHGDHHAAAAAPAGEETVIDLLVVYSAAARQQLGGTAQIEAHAQAAVDNGNLSLDQSLTDVSWNVVHIAEIDYTETGTCGERLGRLRNSPQAQGLRDSHGADMVGMLLADGGGACGCGYVMRNPGPGFSESAFQVTANSCAVGNLTYAHEHGHNSGMEHDPANGASPGSASYPWSFGHFVDGEFRTVMSYAGPCTSSCARQPHFSNPDVLFERWPTGIEGERNNARTAALTAPIIAAFRDRPAPQPDLSVEPAAFELRLLAGGSDTRTLTLINNGNAELQWSIAASPARQPEQPGGGQASSRGALVWLDFDIESGSIAAGEQVAITLTVDTGGLAIGEQTGRIEISTNDPEQPETSVPITLQVVEATILRDRFESLL